MHGYVCGRYKLHVGYSLVELSCTRNRPRNQNNFQVKLHGNACFVHSVLELVDQGKVGSKSLNNVDVSGKQSLIRD